MSVCFDQQAADYAVEFVSRLPTTDTGKHFSLYPWQQDAIREFYGDEK